jgi:spermidine synthase
MRGATPRLRAGVAVATAGVLLVAAAFTTGIGAVRVQGQLAPMSYELLAFDEGPDSTVAAIEYKDKTRALVIEGFQAASEMFLNHYMTWMGHLPMMLSERTDRALVICFGTGQTANAVRREGATRLDIVGLNRAVFAMAGYFPSNEGVLMDPAVHPIVMDERAYLRRSDARYDVITLEPMPPNFAGVNALY